MKNRDIAKGRENLNADEYTESIINTAHEPLIILDGNLKAISASRSFYSFFKVTPEQAVGQSIYVLGNRLWDIPKLRELLEDILPKKTVFDNYEIEQDLPAMGKRTMLLNVRQIKRAPGKEPAIIIAFEDITERKTAGGASRLLAAIVESSDDAIIGKALEGTIISWNKGAEKIYGYTAEEIIGKHISILVPPDYPDEVSTFMERIKQDKPVYHYESVRIRKGGQRVDASLTISPIKDDKGNIIGASTIARDISERKKGEEALQKSEAWLFTTLNSIGDAVIATDIKGCITFINPVTAKISGWKQEEAIDKPLGSVFNIINEKTGEIAENPVAKVIREGVIVGLANHTVLISKEGKRISIDDSAAPIKNKKGDLTGVVLIFRDITERRQAEKELADKIWQLETFNKAAVDRELKMIELKKKIELLETALKEK